MDSEKVSKLLYLKELYEKGAITAEQLADEKAKIMGKPTHSSLNQTKEALSAEPKEKKASDFHKKKKNRGLIAAFSIGVLAIIAGAIYFLLGFGRMNEKPRVYGENRKSKDYIEERVTWIYSAALEGVCGDKEKLMSANMYKSSRMKKLEKQCVAVEQSEPGYLRDWYMDCVDWIFTQDFENPKLVSVDVHNITNDSALATVVIDVFGDSYSIQHVDLWLVYEYNDWFIDDFQPDEYQDFNKTVRDDMVKYLESHRK